MRGSSLGVMAALLALAGCGGSSKSSADGGSGSDAMVTPRCPAGPPPTDLVCDGVVDCDDGRDEPANCCRGCLQGTICLTGNTLAACGKGSAACVQCQGAEVCLDGQCLAPRTCNSTNCLSGCCVGDSCLPGTTTAACGSGANECQVCGANATCDSGASGRACQTPCGPATCTGCCDSTGMCRAGTSNMVCGQGGGSCSMCAGATSCSNGQCIAAGCRASCDGCCRSDGRCVPSEMSIGGPMAMQACGYDGDACDVCGVGEGCANGCSFTACFQTCDGCCDGAGVCHPGLDNTACGRGRGFCRACSAPFSCVRTDPDEIQTFCDIPPGDRFTVDMLAVDVPATKPDGSAWDAFGGLPDLVVDVYAYNPTGASSVTLPEQSGTLHATWSGTAGATVTTVREHLSSIQFRVIDADINNDDLIERCTFSSYIFTQPKLVASLFSGATQECRENGTTFRFKLRRAP